MSYNLKSIKSIEDVKSIALKLKLKDDKSFDSFFYNQFKTHPQSSVRWVIDNWYWLKDHDLVTVSTSYHSAKGYTGTLLEYDGDSKDNTKLEERIDIRVPLMGRMKLAASVSEYNIYFNQMKKIVGKDFLIYV